MPILFVCKNTGLLWKICPAINTDTWKTIYYPPSNLKSSGCKLVKMKGQSCVPCSLIPISELIVPATVILSSNQHVVIADV